ncbi:MAG: hypothetical protein H7Y03_08105 [Chitinophagaceae bacterium]|nr:hypothetical protein [Chitinophagaceae bacterium]
MKRVFTLLSLMCCFTAFSQQYNNEWIDFTKVHYKFKVGQTGLYRIPQTTLNAAGLNAVPAEQFKLVRNGVEVAIYTTSATGPLAAGGYIEFWAEANDGKADRALYRNPNYQHSDKISLQTDTSVYFLLAAPGAHLRITDRANNVSSSTLGTEPFFMHTAGRYFRDQINPGFARNAGEYVYSSSYDQGEYWSSREIYPFSPLSDALSNLAVYTPASVLCKMKFGASGNAQNLRNISVKLNNSVLFNQEVSIFEDVNDTLDFPVSLISSGNAAADFTITPTAGGTVNPTDRIVVSYYELIYPRKFDFGASKNFSFVLPPKAAGYLLSITNFDKGSVPPVLYDLTYRERYTAVYSAIGDSVKFVLPGGTDERNLVLVNEEESNITQVTSLNPKTFLNFTNAANQGDYIIISNPILYNNTDGTNPVNDYRNYRRSVNGGSYNAIIIDVSELVDQFAFGIKKHPSSVKNFLAYARSRFSTLPKYVFMIGRGMDYVSYRYNQSNPLIETLNMIPTFGSPASDNFLGSLNSVSQITLTPI